MKKLFLISILLICIFLPTIGSELLINSVKFASQEKAVELLTQEDDFTRSWSQFDIDSRMQKSNSTREELFEHISKQARSWTSSEEEKIRSILDNIDKQISKEGYNLNFPDEILFVKTTGLEEGGAAGYTRANFVVLKDEFLSANNKALTRIIVHEVFHILTRNDAEFRKKMYSIIGFELMNSIDYPETHSKFRITNPDAPQTDSYIKLNVKGKEVPCMMILYSAKAYNGGPFFDYLNVGFLSLQGNGEKSIIYQNEHPVIYNLSEVSGFFEQIGRNTQYIIHPEEIMADNFSFAILGKTGLPNQDIIDEIKVKLKE